MPSISGYKNRIIATFPSLSDGQAERLAKRIAYRAQTMQEELDFYEALRILGIHADETARAGVGSSEVTA